MSKERSPWHAGRKAWERLSGWDKDSPKPGHPDGGAGALAALADIGSLRHLLDQAELVAVRTARRNRKSWAEIATKLGVTRQSAWERWRELDEADLPPLGEQTASTVLEATAAQLTSELVDEVTSLSARESRRQATVRVPSVIGLTWEQARRVLLEARLVGVGQNPDGPPLSEVVDTSGVVTDQSPESGAKVAVGSTVTLWIGPGGGSAGVREPRRPKPDPKSARQIPSESSEEAVG